MRKTGQCPKCSSTQVVLLSGESVYTKVYRGDPSLVLKYACTDCGYMEEYLEDAKELAALRNTIS